VPLALIDGPPREFALTADDTKPLTPIHAGLPEGHNHELTTRGLQKATGLLTAKEYDDGKEVTYTYTDEGKLETRTWAREVGPSQDQALVTEYIYDSNTGELTQIKYYRDTDETPDPDTPWVTFTYNRLGRRVRDSLGGFLWCRRLACTAAGAA